MKKMEYHDALSEASYIVALVLAISCLIFFWIGAYHMLKAKDIIEDLKQLQEAIDEYHEEVSRVRIVLPPKPADKE